MGEDARFGDVAAGDARPLRLRAEGVDDLSVISSLLQDAVGRAGDISWLRRKHRLVVLANRFRWENGVEPGSEGDGRERVRSLLVVEGVLGVRALGLSPQRPDEPFELLAILFEPGEDGAGLLRLAMAGGAEIAAEVECLDVALIDVSEPWPARARRAPEHPLD